MYQLWTLSAKPLVYERRANQKAYSRPKLSLYTGIHSNSPREFSTSDEHDNWAYVRGGSDKLLRTYSGCYCRCFVTRTHGKIILQRHLVVQFKYLGRTATNEYFISEGIKNKLDYAWFLIAFSTELLVFSSDDCKNQNIKKLFIFYGFVSVWNFVCDVNGGT
jgi:hypothetical protein